MSTLKRATEILQHTEEKLRSLVSEAVGAGDYSSVVSITRWAQALKELTKSVPHGEARPTSNRAAQKPKKAVRAAQNISSHYSQNGYPRFLRHGEYLVRIAWSKREKKEYRHKVPYSILKLLATAIGDKGKDGRVFSTDEFLPMHETGDGTQVPNYQAYVGISLLKQTGLIDQHGRQGYSIPRTAEFTNAVEATWQKLPKE